MKKMVWARRKWNNIFKGPPLPHTHTPTHQTKILCQAKTILKLKVIQDFLNFLAMIQLSLITPQLKANILLYSKNDTKKNLIHKT